MTGFHGDLSAFVQGPIAWLPCTLAIYFGSVLLFRWGGKSPLLNPTLLTIAGIALVLLLTGVPYRDYFEGVAILHYLLGTAVVALALPLHRNLSRLEGRALSLTCSLLAGSLASIMVGLAVAVVAGASASTILSLAPKSATAAVAIEISRLIGGVPAMTATLTIFTGIIGAITGPYVLDLSGIHAPEARGFAMGVASHGIATARAFTESEVAGSFAGLGMTLNAVLTAMVVPPIIHLLGFG
jgi:predicted murein hydrolase (TIGR00659 family)